jgi:hypothetical protein
VRRVDVDRLTDDALRKAGSVAARLARHVAHTVGIGTLQLAVRPAAQTIGCAKRSAVLAIKACEDHELLVVDHSTRPLTFRVHDRYIVETR